jgi:hypothetical protein
LAFPSLIISQKFDEEHAKLEDKLLQNKFSELEKQINDNDDDDTKTSSEYLNLLLNRLDYQETIIKNIASESKNLIERDNTTRVQIYNVMKRVELDLNKQKELFLKLNNNENEKKVNINENLNNKENLNNNNENLNNQNENLNENKENLNKNENFDNISNNEIKINN